MNDCLLCFAVVGWERNRARWAYSGPAGTGCSEETCFRTGGRLYREKRGTEKKWFERDNRKAGESSNKSVSVFKIAEVWITELRELKDNLGCIRWTLTDCTLKLIFFCTGFTHRFYTDTCQNSLLKVLGKLHSQKIPHNIIYFEEISVNMNILWCIVKNRVICFKPDMCIFPLISLNCDYYFTQIALWEPKWDPSESRIKFQGSHRCRG